MILKTMESNATTDFARLLELDFLANFTEMVTEPDDADVEMESAKSVDGWAICILILLGVSCISCVVTVFYHKLWRKRDMDVILYGKPGFFEGRTEIKYKVDESYMSEFWQLFIVGAMTAAVIGLWLLLYYYLFKLMNKQEERERKEKKEKEARRSKKVVITIKPEPRSSSNSESGVSNDNADKESLPSYTIVSGLPSYEEALQQLQTVKEAAPPYSTVIQMPTQHTNNASTTGLAKLSVSELMKICKQPSEIAQDNKS